MPKPELQEFARQAAKASAPANTVGLFVELIDEGDEVYTYLFESKQKGYVGWRWSVTVFDGLEEPSVSEVVLMPGPDSLVAPKWVPWSERLADWKALQAELERQAAEEAALAAEEGEDGDDEEDEDSDDIVDVDDADDSADEIDDEDENDASDDEELDESNEAEAPNDEAVTEEGSAVADLEPSEDAESDAGKARKRIPRFIRRRGRKNKDAN
jgi:hypothetical protein